MIVTYCLLTFTPSAPWRSLGSWELLQVFRMKRDEDVGAWCLVLGRLVWRSLTLSRETGASGAVY